MTTALDRDPPHGAGLGEPDSRVPMPAAGPPGVSSSRPAVLAREAILSRLRERRTWDLVVIGGGATGLGVALDAAARGWSVALVEAADFAQGTSSRATKLLHGGVRYLAQGNLSLVREALHERAAALAHAPHVAQPLGFVVPAFSAWQGPFYGLGLRLYDALAGRRSLGPTTWLSRRETVQRLPTVQTRGLWGGVHYWDGQFDDARLAVLLARTAAAHGAAVANHVAATGLVQEAGQVAGVAVRDVATGESLTLTARCVVNAAGVWVDDVLRMEAPRASAGAAEAPLVAPSQGVHLVVDRAFLPGSDALLVPRTRDGRVLFAVPWLGKTVLGTTDTPRADCPLEPQAAVEEVDFILAEAGRVLARAPARADVRSVWVGLRPLVRAPSAASGGTASLSREHTVLASPSGLVTVTGGKWTTYRAMAEDVLERCMQIGRLPRRPAGGTAQLPLIGAAPGRSLTEPPGEHLYGSEAAALHALPGADRWIARDAETGRGLLSEAMVRFAARQEMARSVEDVLARRCRLLFLDAAQAAAVAGEVAAVLADELDGRFDAGASAAALRALAGRYATVP